MKHPSRLPPILPLPPASQRFLRTRRGREALPLVITFHRWVGSRGLTLADLKPADVMKFLAHTRLRLARLTRRNHYHQLLRYLVWLHERKLLGFHPDLVRRHPKHLPPLAWQFVLSLGPTHKPSTCVGYKTALRKLHAWLDASGLALEELRRAHILRWFQELAASGFQPATRLSILLDVRLYLRWLAEHGALRSHPDELIRPGDMPRLPTYLPRPLPAPLDQELQRRFAASADRRQLGLLLMRRTGLRIGELASLEHQCLRFDPRHTPFLKVPLGKLDNERLVPIDAQTVELVRRLQALGPMPRTWLLQRSHGRHLSTNDLRDALRQASSGLTDSAPITSHRMRHSYATEMLSAGMSLPTLMRILGHRSYHMTLRYAAITDEALGKEYHQALAQIEKRYRFPTPPVVAKAPDPADMLEHLAHWLARNDVPPPRLRPLLKRIQRLQQAFRELLPDSTK